MLDGLRGFRTKQAEPTVATSESTACHGTHIGASKHVSQGEDGHGSQPLFEKELCVVIVRALWSEELTVELLENGFVEMSTAFVQAIGAQFKCANGCVQQQVGGTVDVSLDIHK